MQVRRQYERRARLTRQNVFGVARSQHAVVIIHLPLLRVAHPLCKDASAETCAVASGSGGPSRLAVLC